MNRIILIGNGFDLAHGLETSYNHFINWFWEEEAIKIMNSNTNMRYNDDFISMKYPYQPYYYNDEKRTKYQNLKLNLTEGGNVIEYKNHFLEIITANKALQNWVDIEEVYYQLLVYNANKDQFKAIETLNKEFDDIKNKLEEYLKTQILNDNSHLFSAYENIMFDYIDPKDFTDKDVISQIRNEMYSDHLKKNNITHKTEYGFTKWFNDYIEKENDYRINSVERYFGKEFCICPKFSMFLNFNYTNTLDYYHQMSNQEIVISIHGRLAEHIDNPIIFGYGDEIDENYKMLEKKSIGKNYVLKNMKSANYSKTNNYNRVLNFINSDLYQIIILGHSCGNSDRTLLNKLFEHPNCVSIKPYYYVDKDGKSDYFDKYINISRNFNDKNHLREKVVNERYCGRMPQINN